MVELEIVEEEEYADTRQKFIEAQNDPQETQKLAISLSSVIEDKYGIKIRKDLSTEIVSAYTSVGAFTLMGYTVFGRILKALKSLTR